ncbi:MAG TPA: hypothetical protein VFB02_11690 [Bradyrhizobium sp.]|nr:hypothetical protein [Bradyrhizobium sp.]
MLAVSAAVLGCTLVGCSSPIADMPSLDSADTSAKPKDAYLPVHDLPPDRDDAVITPDQRAKIEAELAAARDRQTQASAAQAPGAQSTAARNAAPQNTAQNAAAK